MTRILLGLHKLLPYEIVVAPCYRHKRATTFGEDFFVSLVFGGVGGKSSFNPSR
jgi:hypothetical protein